MTPDSKTIRLEALKLAVETVKMLEEYEATNTRTQRRIITLASGFVEFIEHGVKPRQ